MNGYLYGDVAGCRTCGVTITLASDGACACGRGDDEHTPGVFNQSVAAEPMIISVWSAYGHRFISDGGEDTKSCLICGAVYVLRDLGDGRGEYTTITGDEPQECSHDTLRSHGQDCEHVDHDCNCVLCDS